MDKVRSVLFVCTGNTCRSVMAAALLKKYLNEAGKTDIEVRSAGISAIDGLPPAKETIAALKEKDIDVSQMKSKRLTDDWIKISDLILVMENMHRDEVIRRVPDASAKTYLLKEFGADGKKVYVEGFSVPDPIGGPIDDYEESLGIIEEQIKRIAKIL